MRTVSASAFALAFMSCASSAPPPSRPTSRERPGVILEETTWKEAEKALTRDAIVVLPLGAGAKEHGPHLLLSNDLLIANYFKERLVEARSVVALPTLPYAYYPAFLEYPGSTSLGLETTRDVVIDIVRSVARHGPRRFYVLNTGISTNAPLALAKEALARDGITLAYTDLRATLSGVEKRVAKQEGGSHADEIETSMMLVIAPSSCDMSKAVKDYDPNPHGGLSRTQGTGDTYSPSGVWGDPTLATREKGEAIVEAYFDGILADVDRLAAAP